MIWYLINYKNKFAFIGKLIASERKRSIGSWVHDITMYYLTSLSVFQVAIAQEISPPKFCMRFSFYPLQNLHMFGPW
jgi:hypothetical protein